MGLHSCIVETRNLRMHYLQKGVGEPVLLVHGWPQSSYEWRHQLDALGEDFACFAPDLRGFGGTDKPGVRVTRSLVATDLVHLLDTLGIERAAVVGHDWGGIAAFKLAIDWPDRVSRLALLDAPCTVWSPNAHHGYWFKLDDLPERFFERFHGEYIEPILQCAEVPAHWPHAPESPWHDVLAGRTVRPWASADDLDHYRAAMADPMTWFHLISYYRDALPFHLVKPQPDGEVFEYLPPHVIGRIWAAPDHERPFRLDETYLDFAPEDRHKVYSGPTLWLRSVGDAARVARVTGSTPYTDAFSRHFPNLEVASIDAGHYFPEERPGETTEILAAFLRKPVRG